MGYELSPARRERRRKAKRRQEQRWARRNGPVTIYTDPTRIEKQTKE